MSLPFFYSKSDLARLGGVALAALMLASCDTGPRYYSPEEIQAICTDERRDAQPVRSDAIVGYNSRTGPYVDLAVTFNNVFGHFRDPMVVYGDCVARLNEENARALAGQRSW